MLSVICLFLNLGNDAPVLRVADAGVWTAQHEQAVWFVPVTMMPPVWTSWATGGNGSLLELSMVKDVVLSRKGPSAFPSRLWVEEADVTSFQQLYYEPLQL